MSAAARLALNVALGGVLSAAASAVVLTLSCGVIGALTSGCNVEAYCLNCRDGSATVDGAMDASTDGAAREGGALTDGGSMDFGPRDARPPCIPPGVSEVCNGEDDDCDGLIDNGIDFQTSPRDCGRCNNPCVTQNADTACESGSCVVRGCLDGYANLDTTSADCEYMCPVFPAATEQCNGLDDDCDGMIDEAAELPPPPADLCRSTAGTPCATVRPACTTRNNITTWYCDYAATVEFDPNVPNGISLDERKCDGIDGNCDGVADESFDDLGQACDDGMIGACRNGGVRRCAASGTATECDLTALPDPAPGAPLAIELCNGIDDDCDGMIDESGAGDASRVRDDMVRVQRGALDFYIYTYEASRPTATATAAGGGTPRACSRSGVQPWANVDFATATAACASAGKRLCTAAEWQAACEGTAMTTYPYGATYTANTCAGADLAGGVRVTGSLAQCTSGFGALDLSGNLKEWTNDQRGMSDPPMSRPIYVIRGGSYESPRLGLTCQTDLSRSLSDTILPSLGFRCCSTTAP